MTIDGHVLIDGGVTNNTPISHALATGADEIWVLPTGYSCNLERAPRTALGMAMQAVTLLVQDRLILDVARYQSEVELHVLPPLCPMTVSPVDFSHTSELIDRARASTLAWLATDHGPDQTAWLGLHHHQGGVAGLSAGSAVVARSWSAASGTPDGFARASRVASATGPSSDSATANPATIRATTASQLRGLGRGRERGAARPARRRRR